MGPNMHVTPPGAFTHLHQDGNGTLDLAHFCLSGCNEVVMLRRLTERHKSHAISLLNRTVNYDVLGALSHGDGLVRLIFSVSSINIVFKHQSESHPCYFVKAEKPMWPSKDGIQKCKEMG